MNNFIEEIIQVAILHKDIIHTMPRPKRHADVVIAMAKEVEGKIIPAVGVQGFLTNTGRFVDRKEGAKIALATGQIKELKYQPNTLFSEDLW